MRGPGVRQPSTDWVDLRPKTARRLRPARQASGTGWRLRVRCLVRGPMLPVEWGPMADAGQPLVGTPSRTRRSWSARANTASSLGASGQPDYADPADGYPAA